MRLFSQYAHRDRPPIESEQKEEKKLQRNYKFDGIVKKAKQINKALSNQLNSLSKTKPLGSLKGMADAISDSQKFQNSADFLSLPIKKQRLMNLKYRHAENELFEARTAASRQRVVYFV